jgi:eukaryotic-like serine/threonine-protein kinase
MNAKVILTVIQGINLGQQYVCDSRDTYIMGRSPDCNLLLADDEQHNAISRYHCLLDVNPPDIRIRDLGSLNGTFVNGIKIGQRADGQTPEEGQTCQLPEHDLKDQDTIQLGETVFAISTVEAATVALAPAIRPGLQLPEAVQELFDQAAHRDDLRAINNYKIVRILGEGGCGAVYLAEHITTGHQIALKIMLPQVATNEFAVQMFVREVANTQALRHPHVVEMLEYGEVNGIFFFTMEYCSDDCVAALMRQRGGKLPVTVAVPLILQVLDGLSYTHQVTVPHIKLQDGSIGSGTGLVHRDLKPANIFIHNDNDKLVAKIGDYGLAKAFELAGLSGQTVTGHRAMGTGAFMCRQQLLSCKYAQPEVDIWATAACLYNMLTGTYPRDTAGQDPFVAVLNNPVVPIRQRDAQIPDRLAAVIDLALQEQPQIYFQNAADFSVALQEAMN